MTVLAMALDSTPPPALVKPARGRPRTRTDEEITNRGRRKRPVAARTIGLRASVAERVELLSAVAPPASERPLHRCDCANVPRPCPYVTCVHNLYLDVNSSGGLKLNFPDLEPDQVPSEWSCALDVADRGGATLEEVASALNITREGVRLIEVRAFGRLEVHLPVLKEWL